MAWGLEARVPFLDKAFLEEAMTINPEEKLYKKGRMEKYILRKAFDTDENPYLPADILWRQKEQFSDGVGYNWIDTLKASTEAHVSDEEMKNAAKRWPRDTPQTKEAYLLHLRKIKVWYRFVNWPVTINRYWYRHQFEKLFPQDACTESVVRWIPRADWGCPADPSGRAQKVHAAAYNVASSVVDAAGLIDKKKGIVVA
jgi:asparagine synthase (glutamine-hydrolysing)